MSLVSIAARNASLAMSYGASKGSLAPDNLEVALFVGDPQGSGTELATTGDYAAVTVPNDATTWPDAPSGGAITGALVEFAASSAAWADTPTHFLLRDAATADAWDSGVLADPVVVADAGVVVRVAPTVYYTDLS